MTTEKPNKIYKYENYKREHFIYFDQKQDRIQGGSFRGEFPLENL